MVECKLRKKEEDPKRKRTAQDDVVDTMRVVLEGVDKDNKVEWTLTLKHEGEELPESYRKVLGKDQHMLDESFATLEAGTQQGRL